MVPDKPNRSNTADEIIIVSMVMPETGLRAVVAMALAATDVKKNEKTSVSASPIATAVQDAARWPRSMATPIAPTTTPRKMDIIGMSRSVRSSAAASTLAKHAQRDPKRPRHNAQRSHDAENARRRDRADSDKPHIAAVDLHRGHVRNWNRRGIDSAVDVAADEPDQAGPERNSKARRRRKGSANCAVPSRSPVPE